MYLGVALCFVILGHLLLMVGWLQLLRYLNIEIKAIAVLQGYIVSFLPRYVPGTVWGYLSRGEWLHARYGVPYTITHLASMLEMGFMLLAVITIMGMYATWYLAVLMPLVVGGSWLAFQQIARVLPNRFQHTLSLTQWSIAYLIYTAAWHAQSVSFMLITTGFSGQVTWSQAIFMYSVAWFIGFLVIIVPTGLGVREATLAQLLASTTTLSAGTTSAIAIMARLLIYISELIWLIIGLILTRFQRIIPKDY